MNHLVKEKYLFVNVDANGLNTLSLIVQQTKR